MNSFSFAAKRRIGLGAFIIECAARYRCHQARIEFGAVRLRRAVIA